MLQNKYNLSITKYCNIGLIFMKNEFFHFMCLENVK